LPAIEVARQSTSDSPALAREALVEPRLGLATVRAGRPPTARRRWLACRRARLCVTLKDVRWRWPPAWYAVLLAAVGLQRLLELRRSRRNEALRPGARAAARSYPLMVAAHVGLVALPLLESGRRPPPRPRWRWGAVLVGAAALRIWSIRSLGPSWNVRASVAPDLEPVTTGPYAFIRHPNYAAVILEFAAVPLIGGRWVSAVVLSALNAAVLLDRIRDEERLLNASAAYRSAFASKARFIPGVF
jgi:methyltransferase